SAPSASCWSDGLIGAAELRVSPASPNRRKWRIPVAPTFDRELPLKGRCPRRPPPDAEVIKSGHAGGSISCTGPNDHRTGHLAVIARRPRRYLAVPLRHALIEHEICRHTRLCDGGGVLPADRLSH